MRLKVLMLLMMTKHSDIKRDKGDGLMGFNEGRECGGSFEGQGGKSPCTRHQSGCVHVEGLHGFKTALCSSLFCPSCTSPFHHNTALTFPFSSSPTSLDPLVTIPNQLHPSLHTVSLFLVVPTPKFVHESNRQSSLQQHVSSFSQKRLPREFLALLALRLYHSKRFPSRLGPTLRQQSSAFRLRFCKSIIR